MQAPPSPCINVCRMDPHSGLCVGCQRTLDEIAAWGSASAERKTLILQEVDRRRRQAGQGSAQAAQQEGEQ